MKQIAFALTMIALSTLFFSCKKDPAPNTPCANADDKADIRIYNGFHVPLDIFVFENEPQAIGWHKIVEVGEIWELTVVPKEYAFTAKGQNPSPPYNKYEFYFVKTAEDCEPLEINY